MTKWPVGDSTNWCLASRCELYEVRPQSMTVGLYLKKLTGCNYGYVALDINVV